MRRLLMIVMIVLSFTLTGCSGQKSTVLPDSYALGYFNSIEYLYNSNPSFPGTNEYLAFDFSNLEFDDLEQLITLVQDFCKEKGYTYLEGTIDELVQWGYIEVYVFESGSTFPNGFPDGVLFQFSPVSIEEDTLVTQISMWKGSLSSWGSIYTATYNEGVWSVRADGIIMS